MMTGHIRQMNACLCIRSNLNINDYFQFRARSYYNVFYFLEFYTLSHFFIASFILPKNVVPSPGNYNYKRLGSERSRAQKKKQLDNDAIMRTLYNICFSTALSPKPFTHNLGCAVETMLCVWLQQLYNSMVSLHHTQHIHV